MKGMIGERDHMFVCVPLAAGVLLASFLAERFFKLPFETHCATGVAFVLTVVCVLLILNREDLRGSAALWCLTFFCCGTLCLFEDRILIRNSDNFLTACLRHAGNAVGAAIDSLPFSDSQDNALMKALVTGDRSGLSAETRNDFRKAGAAHMLALSGMHLGIVYLLVSRSLTILGNGTRSRQARSFVTIAATGLYTLMCGAAASLFRAWLFIVLYESGKICGRPQKAERVLCAALTIHLIVRPSDIAGIGFQLSYLAMVGIVFVWPGLRSVYKGEGLGRKIWNLSALSISCQLLTAPMTYFYFGTFPKYFIVTNLFGAPLLSFVMLCCVATMTLAAAGVPDCCIYNWLEAPLKLLRLFMGAVAGLED